jgi:hypothetical protein
MLNKKNHSPRLGWLDARKTALAPFVFATALLAAPLAANAFNIVQTQICDAATQNCQGNPETDVWEVTISGDQTTGSSEFTIDWVVPAGTGNEGLPVNLTATSTWTVAEFSKDALKIDLLIENTTNPPDVPDNRADMTAFGFGVSPTSTVTSSGATVFTGLATGTTFPAFQQIDVCAYAGQNCSGGGNSGLSPDQKDDLSLHIGGNYENGSVTLLFFASKWQSEWGSFEVGGTPDDGGGPGGGEVPAPAPLALIALGALWFRRLVREAP